MSYPNAVGSAASSSATSLGVTFDAAPANSLILVFAAVRSGTATLAVSGYTGLSTQQTNDAWRSRPFVKLAAGGETSLTITTGVAAQAMLGIVYVIKGNYSAGTAADACPDVNYTLGATGYTFASGSISTTYANSLVVEAAFCDASWLLCEPADCNLRASASLVGLATQMISGTRFKAATGALSTFTYTATTNTNAGTAWTVAIRDDGNNNMPVILNDGRDYLHKIGGYGALTAAAPDSVTGLTTIDGVIMNTVANTTSGTLTLSSGQIASTPWQLFASSWACTQNLTADAWVGNFFTPGGTFALDGKTILLPFSFSTVIDSTRIGEKGNIFVTVDSVNNWAAYQVLAQAQWTISGYGTLTFRPGVTAVLAESGTALGGGGAGTSPDLDDIITFGYFHHRKSGTSTSISTHFAPPIIETAGSSFVGGNATLPISAKQLSKLLLGANIYPDHCLFQGNGQLISKMSLQIGDGATATNAKFTAQSIETPSSENLIWRSGASGAPVYFYGSAADTFDFRAATFSTEYAQPFAFNASHNTSATVHTTGLSIVGPWSITWQGGETATGISMTGSATIETDGATFTDGTISETTSTSAALTVSVSGSTLDGEIIDGTGAAYALELGTAVTAITLPDCTITAGTTDKVHVLKTLTNVAAGAFVVGVHYRINTVGSTDFTAIGASANTIGVNFTATGVGSGTGTADQAVKITISGTTSLAEADCTTAGAPVWVAAPQPTLSATVLANTRCLLWNRTTSAELDNAFVAGTSYSKIITSGASSNDVLDLYTFKEGYEESVATIIYAGANASFAVSQATDAAIQYYRTEESITDYTTLTEFNFYSPDIYIQADDADGESTLKKLFIFYNGVLTTADGATYMRGGVTFNSAFDVVINRSVRAIAVDNVSVTQGLHFTDESTIRVTTDDGTSWIAPPSAPGSIRYAFGVAPGQVETGVSGLTGPESAQLMALPSATAIVATAVDGTTTLAESLRLANAVLGGKVSGANTGTETFRDLADTKNRVVATVDSSGNRTALTRDLT